MTCESLRPKLQANPDEGRIVTSTRYVLEIRIAISTIDAEPVNIVGITLLFHCMFTVLPDVLGHGLFGSTATTPTAVATLILHQGRHGGGTITHQLGISIVIKGLLDAFATVIASIFIVSPHRTGFILGLTQETCPPRWARTMLLRLLLSTARKSDFTDHAGSIPGTIQGTSGIFIALLGGDCRCGRLNRHHHSPHQRDRNPKSMAKNGHGSNRQTEASQMAKRS